MLELAYCSRDDATLPPGVAEKATLAGKALSPLATPGRRQCQGQAFLRSGTRSEGACI